MKAELKPYQLGRRLGSGVKITWKNIQDRDVIVELSDKDDPSTVMELGYKLVLRPLSHLTIPITHNGETFVPMDRLSNEVRSMKNVTIYTTMAGVTEIELETENYSQCIDFMDGHRIIEWLIAHNFHIDEPQGTWISVDELDTNPYEN